MVFRSFMRISLWLVALCVSLAFACPGYGGPSTDLVFRIQSSLTSLNTKGSQISKIGYAKLLFRDQDGSTVPTNDTYLVVWIGSLYPVIADRITGHSLSIKIMDIDGDTKDELLVYYFAGGNQYVVKIYHIEETNLVPFAQQPISSNMRSIVIEKGRITVENVEQQNEQKARVIRTEYEVVQGRLTLRSKTK